MEPGTQKLRLRKLGSLKLVPQKSGSQKLGTS